MGQKRKVSLPGEVVEKMAVNGILAWANTRFPVHFADEDEVPDEVELAGPDFSITMNLSAVADLTACPGCACPLPSDACDTCRFGGAKPRSEGTKQEVRPDLEDVRALLKKYADYAYKPYPPLNRVFQSWHDGWDDLLSAATMSRGGRARDESRAGRMKF